MPRTKALALAAALVLSLASCATVRSRVSGDPLAALGTCDALGTCASLYVVVPVRGNEGFATLAAERLSGKSGGARLVGRLDVIYLAVQSDGTGARRARFVATGNIPKSGARFFLTEEKGWSRRSGSGFAWYRSGPLAVAIPASGVACGVADGALRDQDGEDRDSDAMIPFLRGLAGRDPASPGVSASFGRYAALAREDGRIGFFASDPSPVTRAILGPEVSLPIRAIEGYAAADSEGNYALSIDFSLSDERSARALKRLLSLAFRGAAVTADGDRVRIDGYAIPREKLAAAIDFLYLDQK